MADFEPDPRTPPNVGGPLGVLLKWLDAFLTVIDNVYLRLKSWIRRKGRKSSKRGSKQSAPVGRQPQPMTEKAYTTQTSQPGSAAYSRKSRISTPTESRQLMDPSGRTVSPVSPVSGTFTSSDHSHGPAVVEANTYDRVYTALPTYVPSANNAYAAAMAQPDKPHPHASPKAAPAPIPRQPEPEPIAFSQPQPKPKTHASRLVSEETGAVPPRNPARPRISTDSQHSSTDNPWRPSGPYRGSEHRLSGAYSLHSGAHSVASSQNVGHMGHTRDHSHSSSLAAIAADNSRRSGEHPRVHAVRPLSPQYAPSPAPRSVSPQYGRADTPSYNEFGSRPTSPPQQWEPNVPVTTGVSGTKYAQVVSVGRSGTKYAHVSTDFGAPSSPVSPTASSWNVHHAPSEGHESYNGGWNSIGSRPNTSAEVEAANNRWSAHSGVSGVSNRTRSTFGSPTHVSQARAPQQASVPSRSYAAQADDTASVDSDFSDESLYNMPNPTATDATNAQSYAAAYADELHRRSASARVPRSSKRTNLQASAPARSHTYVRRSEIVA